MTRDAVKSFQKQHALKPTAIVDDALMQLMAHGQTFVREEPKDKAVESKEASITQTQLDTLVRLLVHKGVLEEGELEKVMNKVIPTGL